MPRGVLVRTGAVLLVAALSACGLLLDYEGYTPAPAAGTGGSTSGGGGGGGAPATCMTHDDCGSATECGTPRCVDNVCTAELTKPAGTPTMGLQQPGDCLVSVCGDDGGIVTEPDDNDVPVDENPCTQDLCTGGVPSNPPEPPDTPCGMSGALSCNGMGQCAGCTEGSECGSNGACFVWVCDNSICNQNPLPENGDCGSCKTCQSGLCKNAPAGTQDSDCITGDVCSGSGFCQCEDFQQNGDETAIDCGGMVCGGCSLGETCSADPDCLSGECADGLCCDADCGGACEGCAQSVTGVADGTCAAVLAGLDPKQACLNADTCNGNGLCFCEDKQLNNGEVAADCGGSCPACGTWNCNCGAATGCCVCKSSCDEGTPVCTGLNGDPCKIGDVYLVAYAPSTNMDGNCTAQSLLTCSHKTCVCQ